MLKVFAATIASLLATAAVAEPSQTELKRADVTGTNMEVVVTLVEIQPGDSLERHTHPGEEVVYVLEGATLVLSDGKERAFPTGTTVINARDVPHAGFKVKGDKPLKMLTVRNVDKGKPQFEPAK